MRTVNAHTPSDERARSTSNPRARSTSDGAASASQLRLAGTWGSLTWSSGRSHTGAVFAAALLLAVAAVPAGRLCADPSSGTWSGPASGGTSFSSDGVLVLGGALGSWASGPASDGVMILAGGFWPGVAGSAVGATAGDLDQDGDVDATDLAILIACMSGADIEPTSACHHADLDGDDDVDLADFALLQRCFSGPGIEPTPGCAH